MDIATSKNSIQIYSPLSSVLSERLKSFPDQILNQQLALSEAVVKEVLERLESQFSQSLATENISLHKGSLYGNLTSAIAIGLEAVNLNLTVNQDVEYVTSCYMYPKTMALFEADLSRVQIEQILSRFLPKEQITRLGQVKELEIISRFEARNKHSLSQTLPQVEHLRRLVLNFSKDLCLLITKTCERAGRLRYLCSLPVEQAPKRAELIRLAREIFRVYSTISGRVGMWNLKSRLEDMYLETVAPSTYYDIRDRLAIADLEAEEYLQEVSKIISSKLNDLEITHKISSRSKNIYGIYRKIRRKKISVEALADKLGIRIVLENEDDCYRVLGIIHQEFRHLRGEFDDYIGSAKPNGYQSIHTAVLGPHHKVIEFQIRTGAMDYFSRVGAAAHGLYKGEQFESKKFEGMMKSLEQSLLEMEGDDSQEFRRWLQSEEIVHHIYVFTPQGDTLELPQGATVLDMAFKIHTDLGTHCIGAVINGETVDREHILRTGFLVNVLTSSKRQICPAWLTQQPPIFKTNSARNKIQRNLNAKERLEMIQRGEDLVRYEMKEEFSPVNLQKAARLMHFDNVEEFLLAMGQGGRSIIELSDIVKKL